MKLELTDVPFFAFVVVWFCCMYFIITNGQRFIGRVPDPIFTVRYSDNDGKIPRQVVFGLGASDAFEVCVDSETSRDCVRMDELRKLFRGIKVR